MAGNRSSLVGEPLLSLRAGGYGGDGRPCLYEIRVQIFPSDCDGAKIGTFISSAMSRFLVLLAAFPFALATPSIVRAESHWLVISSGFGTRMSIEKIEMANKNQCEEQGALWLSSTRINQSTTSDKYVGFECLEGK